MRIYDDYEDDHINDHQGNDSRFEYEPDRNCPDCGELLRDGEPCDPCQRYADAASAAAEPHAVFVVAAGVVVVVGTTMILYWSITGEFPW